MHFNQPAVVQLPLLDDLELLKHFKTKKRNVSTIKDFVLLEKDERRYFHSFFNLLITLIFRNLVKKLSDDEFEVVEKVCSQYPILKVVKAYYKGNQMKNKNTLHKPFI